MKDYALIESNYALRLKKIHFPSLSCSQEHSTLYYNENNFARQGLLNVLYITMKSLDNRYKGDLQQYFCVQ
jgi:hypothetical protein